MTFVKYTIVIVLAGLILISSVGFAVYVLSKSSASDMALSNCREDEVLGYLPKGSCKCAQELFPVFSQSYDWMDACKVLKSKNK